jgi:Flp pilus assembly pilin Flp
VGEADDGDRTRDPQLGKLMLYQLSYVRVREERSERSLDRGMAPPGSPGDHESMRKLGLLRRQDGQTAAEYSIILAVITPAIILALAMFADSVAARVQQIASYLT